MEELRKEFSMEELKLATPWVIYVHKLEALFGQDPDINITYNNDDKEVIIRVNNQTKADAIEALLPDTVSFGNVLLYITIVPANPEYSEADLFRLAFAGNPVFESVETTDGLFQASYCIFKNEVVQYPADDLSSYYGIQSTLYEDIADEIFEDRDSIYFCTGLKH